MDPTHTSERRWTARWGLGLVALTLLAAFAPIAASSAASLPGTAHAAAAAPATNDIVLDTPAIALRASYTDVVAKLPAPWEIVTTTSPEVVRPHFGTASAPAVTMIVS